MLPYSTSAPGTFIALPNHPLTDSHFNVAQNRHDFVGFQYGQHLVRAPASLSAEPYPDITTAAARTRIVTNVLLAAHMASQNSLEC